MTDLSTFHQPISDSFSEFAAASAWQENELQKYLLSDDQVASFHENGFLSGIRLLDDDQIDWLKSELAELLRPTHTGSEHWYEYHSNESPDPNQVLFHALGAWRLRPGLHDILWNPAYLVPASQLLGGSVRFWHDQLFCKPARHGGNVAWHQDYSYWTRTHPMAHLTCWFGLDAATRENGCLHYIRGSHRWDLLPITGLAGDMDAIQNVLSEQQWATFQAPVAVELEPGHCTFHHPLTVHGSFENRTESPRRAIVLNLIRDGVQAHSEDPLLAGTPSFTPGSKIEGQFFPLLFDGARLGQSTK